MQKNPLKFEPELYNVAPNLKIFEKLLEYEDKIDSIIKKKKIDIQEQLMKPLPKTKKIMRIKIFNTFENQQISLGTVNYFFDFY